MNVNVIELEDKKDYAIIEEKNIGKITYLLLQEVNNMDNLCIRKRIAHEEKNYIVQLVDEKELQSAINLFIH